MIPPLHPRLVKISRSVKVSAFLEKLAEVHEDESIREKAAEAKVTVDTAIFGMAHFTLDSHMKTAAAKNPIQHSANVMADLAFGLYGFDKLSEHKPIEDGAFLQEALQKMATIGAIEGLLNLVPSTVSEDTVKLAAELRAINRHYGAKLLHEITEGPREKEAQMRPPQAAGGGMRPRPLKSIRQPIPFAPPTQKPTEKKEAPKDKAGKNTPAGP